MPGRVAIGTIAVALIAAGIVWSLMHGREVADAHGGSEDISGVARLNAVSQEEFVASSTPESVREIVDAIEWMTFERSVSADLSVPSPEDLSELVGERFELLLGTDDYALYKDHVLSIIGKENAERLEESTFGDEQRWQRIGSPFRGSLLAPVGLVVERLLPEQVIAGSDTNLFPGGVSISWKDPGIYDSQRLVAQDEPIVRVQVPAIYSYRFKGEKREPKVFIELVFVWDPEAERWLPLESGVHDPAGEEKVLFPPWI